MVMLSKDMSRDLGWATSSPFMQSLARQEYDYEDFIGQEGFLEGWTDRAIAAGSIENLTPQDKRFFDVCIKSRELTTKLKVSNPLTVEDRVKIIDTLIDLGMLEPQVSFGV